MKNFKAFVCLSLCSLALPQIAHPAALALPPGVPRTISSDGSTSVPVSFTTPAFQELAKRLVIEEANRVAGEMQLPEILPITESDVVRSYLGPFGYTYSREKVGNITTRHYRYGVEAGYKLSELGIADWETRCGSFRDNCQWPANRLDTNSALRLAIQWLVAFKVDMQALERDCVAHVNVNEFWNGLRRGGALQKGTFVPIYDAWWSLRDVPPGQPASVAMVELFVPTNTLLTLRVSDAKYLLRPAVTFTNLAAVFPGSAVVRTNDSTNIAIIDARKQGAGRPPPPTHVWPNHSAEPRHRCIMRRLCLSAVTVPRTLS